MSKRKQFITEKGTIYTTHDCIKIDGKCFEVVGAIAPEKYHSQLARCRRLPTILECYSNPSQTKVTIYSEWANFAMDNSSFEQHGAHGICSFNSMIFTFDCIITDNFDNFYAHITPSHNYLYVFGKEV